MKGMHFIKSTGPVLVFIFGMSVTVYAADGSAGGGACLSTDSGINATNEAGSRIGGLWERCVGIDLVVKTVKITRTWWGL